MCSVFVATDLDKIKFDPEGTKCGELVEISARIRVSVPLES